MINLFGKLQKESLLKENGTLLDLGCGDGRLAEPFFKFGYETTLVDKDIKVLTEVEKNFKVIKETGFHVINTQIENFSLDASYDGIIISNVLPFQKDKRTIERIVGEAWSKVSEGGFLYLTLFGTNDQWAKEYSDTMSFYNKDEALALLSEVPYYVSEDYGKGSTMKGGIKTWHLFCFLYIK